MTRHFIIIILSLLVRTGFSQSFLDSYRMYCVDKINSSIQQRDITSSGIRDNSAEKIKSRHAQLNERLNYQIKELATIFKDNYKSTGFDFNKADSLTIIYQTNNKSGLANFMIISGKDTLHSTESLALCREINNGGGKLEPLSKDAASFKVYKTSNGNMAEPLLALSLKADTAYAFASAGYCPVDNGVNSIIITAKKNNGRYEIWDYYLHEFSFAAIPAKKVNTHAGD
jgi:hypothetical protein